MRQGIKLGEVYLDAVVKELPSRRAEVTEKPVEDGVDISDHMKMKPNKIELSGVMVEDAAAKLSILKNYQLNAERLTYIGRNAYYNMVITVLDTDHAVDTAEGYHYNIVLTQVRIAQPETFKTKVRPLKKNASKTAAKKTATKVKKKTKTGRKQIRRKPVRLAKKKKLIDKYSVSAARFRKLRETGGGIR